MCVKMVNNYCIQTSIIVQNWQNTVSEERELTEFCRKLGEFCPILGVFALAHNNRLRGTH